MKASDLIEAIEMAGKVYKEKRKKEMEVFSLAFDEDAQDGERYDILIEACSEVLYTADRFCSSKRGTPPHTTIGIMFNVEDGKIVDRSVEIIPDNT